MWDRGARARAGTTLLEVLVAVTLLGVAAVSLTLWMATAAAAVGRAHASERRLQQASDFLDRVALWPRADLDRRLGDRPQGPWRLHISRAADRIYVVTLTDSLTPDVTLLETVLYRQIDGEEALRDSRP